MSGVLALVLAVLAVCSCGPAMMAMAGHDADPHACCAKQPGISAQEDDCCADHARPAGMAVGAGPPPSGSVTAIVTQLAPAHAATSPALALSPSVPPSAPFILRI